jgi:hypothetical protein
MDASSPSLFRKTLLPVLALAVALLLVSTATTIHSARASTGGSHFSIEPSFYGPYAANPRGYFIYNTYPGAHIVDSVHIVNDGDARGTANIYPVDATTQQTTGTMFYNRTDPRRDVGSWITFTQSQVTLDAGQSTDISFTLTVPSHVRPGQHGGGIILENTAMPQFKMSQKSSSVSIGLHSLLALGVLVNLPGATSENLKASGFHYSFANGYQNLLISLANTGTQLLYPSGSLTIDNAQGHRVQSISLQFRTFLPQTSINYPASLGHTRYTPGQTYTAHLTLHYGSQHTLIYSAPFTVPLPNKGPLTNVIQSLNTPISSPTSLLDQLTPWHYAAAIIILFLLLTALIFWIRQLSRGAASLLGRRPPRRP